MKRLAVRKDKAMAGTKRKTSIEEEISRQEEIVTRSKEKYDRDVKKLKDLYAKRDEARRKALLQAVEKSGKSYEEIMAFLDSEDGEE